MSCLKNSFKIYTKVNIKTAPTCFGVVTPSSRSALLVLANVAVVKIANYDISVCGDVAAYIIGSLLMYVRVCVCVCVRTLHCSEVVYFRTVQRTHIKKDLLIYSSTSPHIDVF